MFGTLSAVTTEDPPANLAYLVSVTLGVVLLPLILAWWRPGTRAVTAMASAYVVGNSVNVVAALLEGADFGDRYAGLSSHPNVMAYGQVLSLALVPFLSRMLPQRFRWVIAALAAVSAYGIWISGSRGALGCAVILTVLYPLLTRSIPAALRVAALCCPAIVLITSRVGESADSSSALGRLTDPSGAASNSARLEGARAGIDQFLAHPWLGDGWLTVWGAHVAYIQIPAAIGIFGLAFYLLLLTSLLRQLALVPAPYRFLAVPVLAAAILDLVLPVVGARYVWLVLGLALCAQGLASQKATHELGTETGPANRRAHRHGAVPPRTADTSSGPP